MIKFRALNGEQNPLRALIVEDDMLVMLDIEEILKSIGISHVDCSTNVEQAAKLLEITKPDFALMDYRVGKATTIDLTVSLQRLKVPFALITGSVIPEIFLSKFTCPILMKPFHEADIYNTVELLLSQDRD